MWIAGALVVGGPTACAQLQLLSQTKRIESQWVGAPSPEITFKTLAGENVRISELRGKRVLLNFWAPWCLPCRVEMPMIDALLRNHDNDGVAVFGISFDGETAIRRFAEDQEIGFPLASVRDGSLPAPYDVVPALPASFVLDADGTIELVHFGYMTEASMKRALWGPAGPKQHPENHAQRRR